MAIQAGPRDVLSNVAIYALLHVARSSGLHKRKIKRNKNEKKSQKPPMIKLDNATTLLED